MIIKTFLLLLISITSTNAATFTFTGNVGSCAGWDVLAQVAATETECQAILGPAVENGGACTGTSNGRITPAYVTQAECENPANGNTCCGTNTCDQNCVWKPLTGTSPHYAVMEDAVRCGICNSASLSSGFDGTKQYSVEPSGITPDLYEEFDPEPNPIDQSTWDTQDTACGTNKFVTIGASGDLECGDCSGSNDPAAFLVEFSAKRDSGTGVKHGKCCINSHHHVCQQLLNSYKRECTDDEGDKGHLTARTCAA